MPNPTEENKPLGTHVFPVPPDDGLLSRLSFKARTAITTGEFAAALACTGVAWSEGGDMSLTVPALILGWLLGSIGIATVPNKNRGWRLLRIIGLLLFFSAVGVFLNWHFHGLQSGTPTKENETPKVGTKAQQTAALLFEWKWARLPTTVPASGMVWAMSINSRLEFGGEPIFLSPRPGNPGDKLGWGEDNRQYGGVYRCDITNYADFPIFNIAMTFKTEFFKPERDGSSRSGIPVETYDRAILVSKLDPKKTFSFYAYSDSRMYVRLSLPKEVTYLRDSNSPRESARLLPQGEPIVSLFPMTLIDQTAKSPAPVSPLPSPPDMQGKKSE